MTTTTMTSNNIARFSDWQKKHRSVRPTTPASVSTVAIHTISYRGKTIVVTDTGYRYTDNGLTWTRDRLDAIKDVIDAEVNKTLPPKRWRY
jgi:hypothetical protein